jgi:hypothetical protein
MGASARIVLKDKHTACPISRIADRSLRALWYCILVTWRAASIHLIYGLERKLITSAIRLFADGTAPPPVKRMG